MDGIRTWGLRIVAGVLALSGVLALISSLSIGEAQLRVGRRMVHLAGMGAVGISLFILGCAGVAFLSSFAPLQKPRGVQFVTTSLLIVGGLLAGLQYVFSAVA